MISIRKAEARGRFDHGWLDTRHTFSFAGYHDPEHMGFRALRVINEDRIQPGEGFGTHSHRDMEIVSYVISGRLAHEDSMGNGSVIPAGDFQYMSAGSGVTHSEFNRSDTEVTHLLQIWILPGTRGLPPRYAQTSVPRAEKLGTLRLVVSAEDGDAPIRIRQDVALYNAILDEGVSVGHALKPGRHAWIQVIGGAIGVRGAGSLVAGDGAAISDETSVDLTGGRDGSELLLFDLG